MGTKSKFFRAFVAGSTIYDGRTITGEMIDQVVETFNLDTYTPRCNVEHIVGFSPEPPFNGYGNVIAVKAQDDQITIDGKTETRRALYCQVDGNDQLTELAAKDQKPFPSVEITDNYAGTGKFGLVGLAFTDRPASIATQALKFSSRAPGTVFASDPAATALEFEIDPGAPAKVESAVAGFFNALAAKFKPAEPEKPVEEKPKAANDNFDFSAFTTDLQAAVAGSITAALKPVADANAALDQRFTALEAKLATTEAPQSFSRPPATGGNGALLTNC